jgi:hypothetical protein
LSLDATIGFSLFILFGETQYSSKAALTQAILRCTKLLLLAATI